MLKSQHSSVEDNAVLFMQQNLRHLLRTFCFRVHVMYSLIFTGTCLFDHCFTNLPVCITQVFFDLLQLIKAERERRQNQPQPETAPKSAANDSVKRSSRTTRTNGGVKSVPAVQNSTKRAKKKKKQKKKKTKKSLGRRHGRRRGMRNVRRTVRLVWRRIATCI